MSFKPRAPEEVRLKRLAQNPKEAVRVDYCYGFHYKVSTVTTPRDFGMHSKKIRKQRK